MSVPAPAGAGTDDERDESRECHRPLEERGRVQRACMPTNHEIFHLLEVAAFGSSGYGLILSMLEIRASPGSVRFRLVLGGRTCRSHPGRARSEEHTSELQSRFDLVCRLLLEKKKKYYRSPPLPRALPPRSAELT